MKFILEYVCKLYKCHIKAMEMEPKQPNRKFLGELNQPGGNISKPLDLIYWYWPHSWKENVLTKLAYTGYDGLTIVVSGTQLHILHNSGRVGKLQF